MAEPDSEELETPTRLSPATVPDRIALDEVVLRRFDPTDAPALARAMRESYDHLHPWLAWATTEGVTETGARRFIEIAQSQLAVGTDANFGVFASSGDAEATGPVVLGGCGLHDRVGPGALEIGYWLHVEATGRGLMTRVVGALTELALDRLGCRRVEIHTDVANTASAAVPRRLGYTLVDVRPTVRPGGPAGSGRHEIWATGPAVDPDDVAITG